MDPDILELFLQQWGEPGAASPASDARINRFGGVLPSALIDVWRRFGFASFHSGLLWLCDPVEWRPAADAWTSRLRLSMEADTWWPIVRSAFGDLVLWGERTGPSLRIAPYASQVLPADASEDMAEPDGANELIEAFFAMADIGTYDLKDESGRPLFDRALSKVGPVTSTQMYSFAPVKQLGGDWTAANLTIEEAIPHIRFLAELGTTDVLGDAALSSRD